MVLSANNSQVLINTAKFPAAKHYYIAYSGGMDSTVLLHILAADDRFNGQLSAIHIDHQINPDSHIWAAHCQNTCYQLKVPIICEKAELSDHSESACREARQFVFKNHLTTEDCLLTAHHQNDQIETIIFRMLRGTGLQGMTGIQTSNHYEHYQIHRPLLHLTKEVIKKYVLSNHLSFVEDPSNQDNTYSRNYIRNVIIPEFLEYDTKSIRNIQLTADNLSQSHQLISHLIGQTNPLKLTHITNKDLLSSTIYHWLNNHGLSAPSHKRLLQFSQDCLSAAVDKTPELRLNNGLITKWKNHLYILNDLPQMNYDTIDLNFKSINNQVTLPDNGKLILDKKLPHNLTIKIKYLQNKETIKTSLKGHNKKIKNLFQEMSIPPWVRLRIPYLYIDNQLMAVGSEIISAEFKNMLSKYKAEYRWLSPQFLL